MVDLQGRFLSFSPPSVTMASINSLPLHLDCLLLVSHMIPLMRPPQVGCTPWVFRFVGPIKYIKWARPNFMLNWAQSLFGPAMARIPFSISDTYISKYYILDYLFYTTFHQNTISLSIFYYYPKSSLSSPTQNYYPQSK